MLCDECGKRPATFHIQQTINGVTVQRDLCGECQKKYSSDMQKKYGSDLFSFSGLGNLFGGLSSFFDDAPEREEYICPTCGTTGEDFLRSGFAGCADCYKEFEPLILPVIRKTQGDVSHVGKVPIGVENSVSNEYERLKKELDKAVQAEEYERASMIQNRMRQLKGEGQ